MENAHPEQVERLRPRLRQARRVCLDYTGPGIGLGDYLVEEFREWEPCRAQIRQNRAYALSRNTLKVEIFSKLRMAFEKRSLRVPVSRVDPRRPAQRQPRQQPLRPDQLPRPPQRRRPRRPLRRVGPGPARRRRSRRHPHHSASVKMHPGIGDMGLGIFRAKDWPM